MKTEREIREEEGREAEGKGREEKKKGKGRGEKLTYYLSSVDYFPNFLNFVNQMLLKFRVDRNLK